MKLGGARHSLCSLLYLPRYWPPEWPPSREEEQEKRRWPNKINAFWVSSLWRCYCTSKPGGRMGDVQCWVGGGSIIAAQCVCVWEPEVIPCPKHINGFSGSGGAGAATGTGVERGAGLAPARVRTARAGQQDQQDQQGERMATRGRSFRLCREGNVSGLARACSRSRPF